MKGIVIKRICSLLFMVILLSCKTTRLPEVSNKLDSVFKEQENLYKKQKVWKYVQWEYKYSRKVIDSIFTHYNLHDSEDFFILTYTNSLADYSLEVKSIDKEINLKFYNGYKKLELLPNSIEMTDFKELVGGDFIEFVNSKTQEELTDCGKKSGIINSSMVLFTHYNKGNITVKRFETCDYAEYFNLERLKEVD
ncbi:hypothetical protein [Paenimyroides ceti]